MFKTWKVEVITVAAAAAEEDMSRLGLGWYWWQQPKLLVSVTNTWLHFNQPTEKHESKHEYIVLSYRPI